jgi:hypothetical protein
MRDARFSPPASAAIADAVLERYLLWRQATVAVTLTYQAWTHGPPSDRELAYADYGDALDAEERAAVDYQKCLHRADRDAAA